jgi:hypothetical protein
VVTNTERSGDACWSETCMKIALWWVSFQPATAPPNLDRRNHPAAAVIFCSNANMPNRDTVGLTYGALRKECLEAVRHWPGCETVAGIQIIRDNTPAGFSVRVTLYGNADAKIADRAIKCVQREKQRYFHLAE